MVLTGGGATEEDPHVVTDQGVLEEDIKSVCCMWKLWIPSPEFEVWWSCYLSFQNSEGIELIFG